MRSRPSQSPWVVGMTLAFGAGLRHGLARGSVDANTSTDPLMFGCFVSSHPQLRMKMWEPNTQSGWRWEEVGACGKL